MIWQIKNRGLTKSLGLSRMGDKNEGIFLWLLEHDRQKNRARLLEEVDRDSAEPPLSGPNDSLLGSEIFREGENRESAFSEFADLEQLLKAKIDLEDESHRLDEIQEKLNLRTKMLCEKIIQETKKRNSEKQQAVKQLQTRISSLETQLGSLSGLDNSEK